MSVFAYGIYTGIQKQGLEVIGNPISFAFYTTCYCLLFLFPLALFRFNKIEDKQGILAKSNLISFFSVAFLSQFAATIIKLKALSLVNATTVGFMTSFSSVILSLFSVVLLREKLPRKFFSVLLFMSLGLALFKYEGSGFSFMFGLGELLTLVFISLSALSSSVVKLTTNRKISPVFISFGRMLFALPLLGLATYLGEGFKSGYLFSIWPLMAGLLYSVRITTLYGGMSLIKLSSVAIFNVFAPIITFAYGFVVFGERLNLVQMLGAVIILGGAYFMVLIRRQRPSFIHRALLFFGLIKKKPVNWPEERPLV